MDRRKRFLEAALASAASPSPQLPPLPALETLRRDNFLPPHLNAAEQYVATSEANLEAESKLSFWRMHSGLRDPVPGQLFCNPASVHRFHPLVFDY
jgi:hypothetical protein